MKYTNLEFPSITLASGLSEANVLNIIQQALEAQYSNNCFNRAFSKFSLYTTN